MASRIYRQAEPSANRRHDSRNLQWICSLLNAATGDNLAQEQLQASKKDDVLSTLGTAVTKLRAKLGESLASLRKFDKPLDEATTSSLEALKAYTESAASRSKGSEAGAVPLFKHAIELDPNFATAHAILGTSYNNLGQVDLYEKYLKQAFDLKDRSSERERFYIAAHYYDSIGDIDQGCKPGSCILRPIRMTISPPPICWFSMPASATTKAP